MAQAYTPALEVSADCIVVKVRELPLLGQTLVSVGSKVEAHSPVLAAKLPGELVVVRLSDLMGIEPHDAIRGLLVRTGDLVQRGQLLSEVKTFFGLFTAQGRSPVEGVVEFIVEATAHVGVRLPPSPLTINAYVDGTVVEVKEGRSVTIESRAALLQGVFGVGGERQGTIFSLNAREDEVVLPHHLESISVPQPIIIGGGRFSDEALVTAAKLQAAAVVTGSVSGESLERFIGHPIGVSITGDEDVPFTLIITEGFGKIPLSRRIADLARHFNGRKASVNGATQVRAGAMRPEVIIPHNGDEKRREGLESSEKRLLVVGSRVRLIRVPHFGKLAAVSALPSEPIRIETGAYVRVLRVMLDDGTEAIVPRANVELI